MCLTAVVGAESPFVGAVVMLHLRYWLSWAADHWLPPSRSSEPDGATTRMRNSDESASPGGKAARGKEGGKSKEEKKEEKFKRLDRS